MNIVLLNGMDKDNTLENHVESWLEGNNYKVAHFKIRNLKLGPCRSCGSCGTRTPGRCVIKDDIESVMKATGPADIMIFLTPVRFGGYSAQLKKVLDRFMLLGLPLYFVKDGHLLHPNRYGKKTLFALGVESDTAEGLNHRESMGNFQELVAANALNLIYDHATIFLNESDNESKWTDSISRMFKEMESKC
jgi:multimeric flavodoxin WrbA